MPAAIPMVLGTVLSMALAPKPPKAPSPAPIPKAPEPAPLPEIPEVQKEPTISPEDAQASEAEKQRALKRRRSVVIGSLLDQQQTPPSSTSTKSLLGQ